MGLNALARLLGVKRDHAEDALHSERAARAVLTRRNLFAAGGALAAGSVFSFLPSVRRPRLRIFAGPRPRNPDIEIAGDLTIEMLADIELEGAGREYSGLAAARNTGIATFARLINAQGEAVADFGPNELLLDNQNISVTQEIQIGLTIEAPFVGVLL